MNSRKILVVAPDLESLPKTAIEIAAIHRYHPESKILRGIVRDEDIARAISDDSFEIIWFVSHGERSGILLSDDYWLPTAAVVQYVRADGIALCILNTCSSEDIALDITSAGGADVICTIGPVDNGDAVRMGQLLAAELAYTETFREAYELVAPDGSNYRYYESGVQRSAFRDGDEMLRRIYNLESDIRLLRWQNWATLAIVLIQGVLLTLVWVNSQNSFSLLFSQIARLK